MQTTSIKDHFNLTSCYRYANSRCIFHQETGHAHYVTARDVNEARMLQERERERGQRCEDENENETKVIFRGRERDQHYENENETSETE